MPDDTNLESVENNEAPAKPSGSGTADDGGKTETQSDSLPNPKPSLTTPEGRPVMPPPSRRLKNGLGFLHLILPLLLIYMLFKVWPPHEWPRAAPVSPSPTATPTPTPTPTQTPAQGAGTTATGATATPTRQPVSTTTPATTTQNQQGAGANEQNPADVLVKQAEQFERVSSALAKIQQTSPNNNQSKLDMDEIVFFSWFADDNECTPKSTPTPTPTPAPGATPAPAVSPTPENTTRGRTWRCGIRIKTSIDERFLLLVIVCGALGSYIHAATSYADYLGNRKFTPSWTWWYLLRTLIGTGLALVVYFAIRGGFLLLANDVEADKVNPYGIAAIAALVGMFSKQATDKLNEVFSTLFRPKEGSGDALRKDSLDEVGAAISPKRAAKGSGTISLTVTGNNFVGPDKSVVRFAPKPKTGKPKELKTDKPKYDALRTQFKSANQLIADLDMNRYDKGTYLVWVFTPEPGGGETAPVEFEVFETTET
ncbi:MAG TPA: hypothetical protein VK363_19345 [Pyrinomonadaceae bacterium]|nr:hypothetical protein [Pyrinomonadaceae bacterium]